MTPYCSLYLFFIVACVSKYAFDRDEIADFVERFYCIPIIWTNLDVSSEASLAALQIVRLLEIAAGYRRQNRDYSLASLLQATTTASVYSGLALSTGTTLSGLHVGSNLGSRLNTTPSLLKTPIPYRVPVTVLEDDEKYQEREKEKEAEALRTSPEKKHLRGTLEDEDDA